MGKKIYEKDTRTAPSPPDGHIRPDPPGTRKTQTSKRDCGDCVSFSVCYMIRDFIRNTEDTDANGALTKKPYDAFRWFVNFAQFCAKFRKKKGFVVCQEGR